MDDHVFAAKSSDLDLLKSLEKPKINSWKELLRMTKLDDVLLHKKKKIISVKSTEPVSAAFKLLAQNQILSVPVFDMRKKKHNSFLDMIDILHLALDTGEKIDEEGIHSLLSAIKNEFDSKKCSDICDLSKRNLYYEIDLRSPLLVAMETMIRQKIHRLAVVDYTMDSSDNLYTIITQSQIITFIYEHLSLFSSVTHLPVKNLFNLEGKKVICVEDGQLALDAFKLIRDKKVSGIGVLHSGKVIDCLSASDLRLIGADLSSLPKLFVPASVFVTFKNQHLASTRQEGILSVTPDTTLAEVITMIHEHKVHRLFVVADSASTSLQGKQDQQHHIAPSLLGIISLIDIMKAIVELVSSPEPQKK